MSANPKSARTNFNFKLVKPVRKLEGGLAVRIRLNTIVVAERAIDFDIFNNSDHIGWFRLDVSSGKVVEIRDYTSAWSRSKPALSFSEIARQALEGEDHELLLLGARANHLASEQKRTQRAVDAAAAAIRQAEENHLAQLERLDQAAEQTHLSKLRFEDRLAGGSGEIEVLPEGLAKPGKGARSEALVGVLGLG